MQLLSYEVYKATHTVCGHPPSLHESHDEISCREATTESVPGVLNCTMRLFVIFSAGKISQLLENFSFLGSISGDKHLSQMEVIN